MGRNGREEGVSRRDFLKTLGGGALAVGGLAAGSGLALAAGAPPGPMPRRRLGRTGVSVSALCLGGMFDTLNNQPLLRQAFNWGVTYWDTAEGYGNGMSEEGFGRFFARNPDKRKDIFLVTKHQPRGGDHTARLEKSLKRLNTGHVDLFFVHSLTASAEMTPELAEWGAQMKKAGKIRFFGFSTHTNMEECLLGAAKLGFVDAVMFTYNYRVLQNPRMQEAVAACTKAGVGLVAMKTMGMGPDSKPSAADATLRLRAVWQNPDIASICSQMPSVSVLAANAAVAREAAPLTRAERSQLRQVALETGRGYCAGCAHVCLAALDGQVPVNEVMRSLMYWRDYGEPDLAKSAFAALPAEVRQRLARLDYAKAEAACPQRLAIAELVRAAAGVLA
jgi:aryl-alcohol dehydrogenase-like predicted oxidoreductase